MAFVLIVDDEFGLADVIGEVLTEAGYETAIAINGELALQQMDERLPDLVLLDVMMPILDGPETLRRMRASAPLAAVPVLVMSALPESAARAAIDAPSQGLLRKPFSPKALLTAVRAILPPG